MRLIQRSFTAGEITPELVGRADLQLYQSALETAHNFLALPHGPASYRPGFQYIQQAKGRCRVIPFVYSASEQYIIEFGAGYVRFHTDGGTVLESGKDITLATQASTCTVTSAGHGYSNGDWVYVTGVAGMTQLNGRYFIVANKTTDTFQITDLRGTAINSNGYSAYTSGGTVARVYEVATNYTADELFAVNYAQSNETLTLVHPSHPPRVLVRNGAASWWYGAIVFGSAAVAPDGVAVSSGSSGSISYAYVVTTVAGDIDEESVASAVVSIYNDLTVAGTKNTIVWDPPDNYKRFRIYKRFNGLFGYIGSTDAATFDDTNITPDMAFTPPEDADPFDSENNYPAAVGHRGQRRIFAGTNLDPQKFWMTKPGADKNLNTSVPVRDDDAIVATLASLRQNRIQHIVNDEETLLLTNGGVWKVTGDGGTVLSPSTVTAKRQRAPAAHNIQPLDVDDAILYVQSGGSRVVDLIYNWESNTFAGRDVSIYAMHLTDGKVITDWASTSVPYSHVWVVLDDGSLLCLTYSKQQELIGWTRHSTAGEFESVAAINEAGEDRLYASIKRTVDGQTVRYIERLAPVRQTGAVEDAFYVDSGLTYSGAETSTITGLWHLEGETVSILADGSVQESVTVDGGSITLQEAAAKATVGLPYSGTLKTLPMAMQIEALGQGRVKNVSRLFIRVLNTRGLFAGPSLDKLTEHKQRSSETYGTPTSLASAEVELPVYGEWTRGGSVYVTQTYPLPCTVSAIVAEVDVGK